MKKIVALALAASLFALPPGCANMNKTQQGALGGTAAGAVIGAGIGAVTGGSGTRGALIGGALGGVAGAIWGHNEEKSGEA